MDVALIVAGVFVSLIVELIKRKFGTSPVVTTSAALVLAVIGSVGFFFIEKYGFTETFIQIAMTAGAFYAFILKNVSEAQTRW